MNKIERTAQIGDYIKKVHLLRYKDKLVIEIENKINSIDWNRTSNKYQLMFQYLKRNIEKLLVASPKSLEQIIFHIEKHYFIATEKIKSLISKRKCLKIKRASNEMQHFIINNNLERHLGSIHFGKIKDFDKAMKQLIDQQILYYISGETEEILECLKGIFDYESFYTSTTLKNGEVWGAYEYLIKLNCNICPYCDRQFVYTFNTGTKKVRAEIDHFLPKFNYPYLALSIMNLVPSCHQCNSSCKGTKDPIDKSIIHPFIRGFDNHVSIEINPYDSYALEGVNTNFDIEFIVSTTNNELKRQLNNSINMFALEETYAAHKFYIRDLLRKAYIYNNSMLKDISKILSANSTTFTVKELKKITFPELNLTDQQKKHVLSKLGYDIVKKYTN
ncbi:HNH endonuclease [Lysinibacillus fusiformis]|uniref:HNH endonuclease n=1 Tax=Lysinibacillus fusiformis TaxID=28031 RepID=UPI0012440CA2|nr:HNH endonuclease [Lysinibacillus fusiformis]KAB0443986.1 hypothetical protein CH314_10320 [Lysinibacillus fusiformis]